MFKKRLTWIVALVAVALLLPVTPVLADDEPPGITIFGEDYTVESGTTIKGNLTVFDGDVIVKDGGTVAGTIIIWGGNAEIEGIVEGDVIVSGGDVHLGDNAWVQGDVVCSWDCSIEQEADTRLDGEIVEGVVLPQIPSFPEIKVPPSMNVQVVEPGAIFGPLFNFVRNIISAFVVAALAVLVTLLMPQQTAQVGQTLTKAPWPSWGYGLLTALAAGTAIIVLTLTICLSPIAILAGLALLAAGLYGWICFGAVIGERLLKALSAQTVDPVWAAGLGTLIISLIAAVVDAGFSLVCCLEAFVSLAVFIFGCAGLGAVVLTRFGSQPYQPAAESADFSDEELVEEI
jgi:hypothetical protein